MNVRGDGKLPKTFDERKANLAHLHAVAAANDERVKAGTLRKAHVEFWQAMSGKFGQAWFNNHGAEPTMTWIALLDRYATGGNYAAAATALEKFGQDWRTNFPPSTDQFEKFLKSASTAVVAYNETERRHFWRMTAASEVVSTARLYERVAFGAGWGDLPTEMQAVMRPKIEALVDWAVHNERPPSLKPYNAISAHVTQEIRTEMRVYKPVPPSELPAAEVA